MKLLETLLTKLFETHPVVVLVMLVTSASIIGYSYRVFAEDADLKALEVKHDSEFSYLSRKISYGFAEIKLRTVEGEIFQIESALQKGEMLSPRDYQRLSTLRSDLSGLVRQLQQIESGEEL